MLFATKSRQMRFAWPMARILKKRYSYGVLVRKREGWRPLGRRKVINCRIDLKKGYGNK